MTQHTVLLIEDDRFLVDIYTRYLREAGFEVRHASTGEEGFEGALKDPPDVIVLAIALPKKNGFEILEELKTHTQTKKIPVLMLTNLSAREDIERCLSSGACDYLIKSHHTVEEIVARVKKHFSTKK